MHDAALIQTLVGVAVDADPIVFLRHTSPALDTFNDFIALSS